MSPERRYGSIPGPLTTQSPIRLVHIHEKVRYPAKRWPQSVVKSILMAGPKNLPCSGLAPPPKVWTVIASSRRAAVQRLPERIIAHSCRLSARWKPPILHDPSFTAGVQHGVHSLLCRAKSG
jgi:hypothetical protein